MTYQDLTAPADKVRVSRREAFSRAYEFFQDETTPQPFAADAVFSAELTGPDWFRLALQEGVGIDRLNDFTLMVTLTTQQMETLSGGAYQLLLFSDRPGVRDVILHLQLQVER